MGLIYNASNETQKFQAFGNYFEMAPKATKMFTEKLAHFIKTERGHLGLVELDERFEDPAFKATEEGKKALQAKEAEGVDARCAHLRRVIYNNEVSLRRDLEQANIKVDPKIMASDGEIAAYRELAGYKKAEADTAAAKVEELKKLEKQIRG